MTAFGVMKHVFADREISGERIAQTVGADLRQYSQAPLAPGDSSSKLPRFSTYALAEYLKICSVGQNFQP